MDSNGLITNLNGSSDFVLVKILLSSFWIFYFMYLLIAELEHVGNGQTGMCSFIVSNGG